MTITAAHSRATEQRGVEDELARLPLLVPLVRERMNRIRRVAQVPGDPRILDLGSGIGGNLAAFAQLGYQCEGVEPWAEARETTRALGERLGTPLTVVEGAAERIPHPDATFDLVHSSSVIEHALDVDQAFSEVFRVLKPGGAFWFNAASSMCPAQPEIRGFPLFGWYPDRLKRRIMYWARDHRPHLVGYTSTPAINWFTPGKARRLLKRHGFARVYDRWDVRGGAEGGRGHALALRVIRANALTKTLADVVVAGCSYVAVKG